MPTYSIMKNEPVQRNIQNVSINLGSALSKLSSGKRINRAADDAAGLAIAEKMGAQIKSLDQATRNVADGAAMVRTAEGGMNQISDLLVRGRELATQASNGTLSQAQRDTINNEFTQVMSEIDRQAGSAEFNGNKLLTGELDPNAAQKVEVQAGANGTPNDRISLNQITAMDTQNLGLTGQNVATAANATAALGAIDSAISSVAQNRANAGTIENRLTSAAKNIAVEKENLMAAQSQIQDLDYAQGVSDLSQQQTLMTAGVQSLRNSVMARQNMVGGLINAIG